MTSSQPITLPTLQPLDRALAYIIATVLSAHAALLLWTIFFSTPSAPLSKSSPPRKFVVQTVELKPQAPPPPARAIKAEPMIAEAPRPVEVIKEPVLPPVAEPVVEKEVAESQPKAPPPKAELKPEPKKPEVKKAEPIPQPKKKVEPPKPQKSPPAPVKKEVKPSPKPVEKTKQPAPKKEVKPPQPPRPKAAEKPVTKPAAVAKASPTKDDAAEKAAEAVKQQQIEQQRLKEAAQQAAQQAERQRQRKLVAEAEERIAKIAAGHGKVDPGKAGHVVAAAIPSAITSLHIDALPSDSGAAPLSYKEAAYRDELAGRLKLLLRLPEYGDVKVKLTLERSGKVSKVVVVSSESGANRKYIEKTLPGLTFPPFGTNFESEANYTFSITLSNE